MRKILMGCGTLVTLLVFAFVALVVIVNQPEKPECARVADSAGALLAARAGFQSTFSIPPTGEPTIAPGPGFQLVSYRSGNLNLGAYVSEVPPNTPPGPGVIWLVGGFGHSPGDTPWAEADPQNDQSGSGLWKAGIPMMYPVLRGSEAPQEGYYGEVDDVISTARAFANMPHVDPEHIVLAGHSTGGLLALLVAAASPPGLFQEVISFGPAGDIASYGEPWASLAACERELRSPKWFMSTIETPTQVIEGEYGNPDYSLTRTVGDAPITFIEIPGADHFTHLHASTAQLAVRLKSQ